MYENKKSFSFKFSILWGNCFKLQEKNKQQFFGIYEETVSDSSSIKSLLIL